VAPVGLESHDGLGVFRSRHAHPLRAWARDAGAYRWGN
jgi:hypothetical protein